jgi:hypothetical protein
VITPERGAAVLAGGPSAAETIPDAAVSKAEYVDTRAPRASQDPGGGRGRRAAFPAAPDPERPRPG